VNEVYSTNQQIDTMNRRAEQHTGINP
jgi:hypothetical protein